MHPLDAGFVHRLLAGFDDPGLDLSLALPDDLLDPPRMDAAVGDQPLERQAADFAAYRIEAGDHHGVGRVVDDHVHAGGGLEGADVPAFASDDPSLHLVGGEGDGGHRAFGGVLGGDALDGDGEDLLRLAVGVLLRLLLQVARQSRRFAPRLVLEPAQQLLLRLLRSEPGDLLETGTSLGLLRPHGALSLTARLLPAPDLLSLPLEAGELLVQLVLASLDLAPAPPYFLVPRLARLHQFFFGGEDHPLTRVLEQALGLSSRGSGCGDGGPALDAPAPPRESLSRGDPAAKDGCNDCPPVRHRYLSPATLRLEGGACRTANGAVRFRPSAVQLMADG